MFTSCNTLSRIAKIRSRSLSNSTLSLGERALKPLNEMNLSPFTSYFSRERIAFTLAEILITIGVIGVVAAVTMPSLVANFTYDNSYSGHGGGTYGYGCVSFYVDINGKKGPNEIDKDIFLFWLVRDGVIPAGMPQENIWCNTFQSACGKNATNRDSLHHCTAWALTNKNMDYLKCSGLSWNGKQSCRD